MIAEITNMTKAERVVMPERIISDNWNVITTIIADTTTKRLLIAEDPRKDADALPISHVDAISAKFLRLLS